MNTETHTSPKYIKDQTQRIGHNLSIIEQLITPEQTNYLNKEETELVYTCINDSLCRIEGILNYDKL